MATTTPNYGWTVPTSTDLVKDGATAIETLGDAIDASMNTALGTKKAGMVLLSTTSFTGSSSVIRNDFSATYSHYRVLFNIVMSGSNSPTLRFTDSSGASVSSAGYYAYTSNYASTSVTNWSNSGSVSSIALIVNQGEHSGCIDFYNPYSSTLQTKVTWDSMGSTTLRGFGAGGQNTAAQNNGFEFYPNTGTITGTISVYGYNK
jgi:hypothetical protein